MPVEKPFNGQLPVHMSREEVEELSRAQGGIDLNNELGVPQFLALGQMIEKDPTLKESLSLAIQGYMKSDSEERQAAEASLEHVAEKNLGDEPHYNPDAINEDPEAKALAQLGTDGDNEIALMPENLFELIWENSADHFRQVNPNTGLPEFSAFGWLGKIFGGIVGLGVGFLTANPVLGMAIGSGVGSLGADVIENKKPFMQSLFDAGTTGLAAYGLGSLGAGAMGGAGTKAGAWGGFKEAGKALYGDPLFTVGMPTLSGLSVKEQQDHAARQNLGNAQEYNKTILANQEDERKRHMARMGFSPDGNYQPINAGYKSFRPKSALQSYAEGGEVGARLNNIIDDSMFIDGYDDGRADEIKVKIRRGSHVIPARIVSKLGSGNSKAGAKALAEELARLPLYDVDPPQDHDFVDASISSGEHVVHPKHVMGFGRGILATGHDVLRDMINRIDAVSAA